MVEKFNSALEVPNLQPTKAQIVEAKSRYIMAKMSNVNSKLLRPEFGYKKSDYYEFLEAHGLTEKEIFIKFMPNGTYNRPHVWMYPKGKEKGGLPGTYLSQIDFGGLIKSEKSVQSFIRGLKEDIFTQVHYKSLMKQAEELETKESIKFIDFDLNNKNVDSVHMYAGIFEKEKENGEKIKVVRLFKP